MAQDWFQHPNNDTRWHAGRVDSGRVLTLCRGSWPLSDGYAHLYAPPQELRCECCQRALIDVKQIERGLDELFDLGGEG